MMDVFLFCFLEFISYSFLGWIIEVINCSITEKKICINRGFLVGPYLPIFGIGSMIVILFFSRFKNNIVILFIISVISLSLLEYFTSFIMEKIFKARWWSYEKRKCNINGRISLVPALGFGLLSIILLYIVNPFYINVLNMMPLITRNTISIFLLIVFVIDLIISSIIIFSLRKRISNSNKDVTEKVSRLVKRVLINRLEKSFPNVKYK